MDILGCTLNRQSKSIAEVAKEILSSEKLCPSQDELKQATIEQERDSRTKRTEELESWFYS